MSRYLDKMILMTINKLDNKIVMDHNNLTLNCKIRELKMRHSSNKTLKQDILKYYLKKFS